jgi:hypothetical protein
VGVRACEHARMSKRDNTDGFVIIDDPHRDEPLSPEMQAKVMSWYEDARQRLDNICPDHDDCPRTCPRRRK